MHLYQCKTLQQAEEVLEDQFSKIRLIGELQIHSLELGLLLEMLNKRFEHSNYQQKMIISSLWKRYPLCCLTVTVFIGILYYDGNYWGHFTRETGCDDVDEWKQQFWDEVMERELLVFDPYGARRFVSTILGHAGVPVKSFSGFIEGFIKPAVSQQFSAAEALDALQSDGLRDFRLDMLHKGVRDYLTNGGKASEDFVDRCMQVFEGGKQNIAKFKGFLPRRILKSIEDWMSQHDGNTPAERASASNKLIQPTLLLAQYRDGVYVHLPSQITRVNHQAHWLISGGNTVERIPCESIYLFRTKEWQLVPAQEIISLLPDSNYTVSLVIDNEVARTWQWDTGQSLLFDPKSRKQIRRMSITHGSSWIVLNKRFRPLDNRHLSVLPERLWDSWGDYILYEVSSETNTLFTARAGQETVEIPVLASIEMPYFERNNQSFVFSGDSPAFYRMPNLCIPVSYDPELRLHTSEWTVTLSQLSGKTWFTTLDCVENEIKIDGDHYVIPLSSMFENERCGNFTIRFMRSLGNDVVLGLTILPPSLKVEGMNQPEFPFKYTGGYTSTPLQISLEAPYLLTVLHPSEVDVSRTHKGYMLTVPPLVSQISCQIVDRQSKEAFLVRLHCKAISWKVTPEDAFVPNQLIKVSEAVLQGNKVPRIIVDTYGLRELVTAPMIELTMSLRSIKGIEMQRVVQNVRPASGCIIDLSTFRDTILATDTHSAVLWIHVGTIASATFPIAHVTQDMRVVEPNFMLSHPSKLVVKWSGTTMGNASVIRVWDESRPWMGYRQCPVTAMCETVLEWDHEAIGTYLFEWVAEDTEDDVFSFLADVEYPGDSTNTARWTSPNNNAETLDFAVAACSMGKCRFVDGPVRPNDMLKIVEGFRQYGGVYVDFQTQALDHWRRLGSQYREDIVQALFVTDINLTETNTLLWLFGITEWDTNTLLHLPAAVRELWLTSVRVHLPKSEFGDTRSMCRELLQKPSDDLLQILQQLLELPAEALSYNTPAMLTRFLIRYKNDYVFREQVFVALRESQRDVNNVIQNLKQVVPKEVLSLLDLRWDERVDGATAYLYLVAVTALLCRLYSRGELGSQEIHISRNMERAVYKLTPELLAHDLYFFESYLFHTRQDGAVTWDFIQSK